MPNTEDIETFLVSIYQGEFGNSPRIAKRLAKLVLHPVLTCSALRYVAQFPIVDIGIADSEKSKAQWMFDSRRPWRVRGFVLSYLELPSPLHLYWQGTPMQNLRTRSNQARAAGYTVRAVVPTEISGVLAQVFRGRGWDENYIEETLRQLPSSLEETVCVGVFDPSAHPVGFCIGAQAGHVVRTLGAATSEKGTARWLCFSGYVEEVNTRGARFIIESPPWAFIGGNKIFAGHLGFTPARIRSR